MQSVKLNLKSIKNVLSRAEMRKIMAGSGSCDAQTCTMLSQQCCPGYYCAMGSNPNPGSNYGCLHV